MRGVENISIRGKSMKRKICLFFSFILWIIGMVFVHEMTHVAIASYYGVDTEVKFMFFTGWTEAKNLPEDPQLYSSLLLAQSMVEVAEYVIISIAILVFIALVFLDSRDQ